MTLHLERSGDTIMAWLGDGITRDHPLIDISISQPYWFPKEDKPVWVCFYLVKTPGCSSYYIRVYDTTNTEAILYHGIIYENKNSNLLDSNKQCLKKLVSEKEE